jgi:mRNA interferase RelE/StbE
VAKYSVEIKASARKELDALPDLVLARVVRKLDSLTDTPRPAECKKLKGYKDQWRIRIGDWLISTSSMSQCGW